MASSLNMSEWMTTLRPFKGNTPLKHIAIPGTHDSFSYAIDPTSEFAPDNPPWMKIFGKGNVCKWSITQDQSSMAQLDSGIRYFDLRVAFISGTNTFHFVHGLVGNEVKQELDIINTFLNDHPGEVVILDFNHFYEMDGSRHKDMVEQVNEVFDTKLCPPRDRLTLDIMMENKQQVVLIYQNEIAKNPAFNLWPGDYIASPWPNTSSVDKLIKFLSDPDNLPKESSFFHVCQGVLTPDTCFILKHLCGSLKDCGKEVAPALLAWLENKRPGPGGVNIVITDFSDLHDTCIPKKVVSLNFIE